MSRKRRNEIDCIVRRAEAEGLSYGKYVARESTVHVKRRPPLIGRKQDVCAVAPRGGRTPPTEGNRSGVSRGISTIQAALRIDCPSQCAVVKVKKPPSEPKCPFAETPDAELDEAARLYKLGYSVTSIAKKLGVTRFNITERLRRAEVEIRSGKRGGLPAANRTFAQLPQKAARMPPT